MKRKSCLFREFPVAMCLISAIGVTSCSNVEDQYDPGYNYNSKWTSIIGSIDPAQNWSMTTNREIVATINLGTTNSYTLKLYTEDPSYSTNSPELIASANADGGATTRFSLDLPTALDTLYVGCADTSGSAVIVPAIRNGNTFTVTLGNATKSTRSFVAPTTFDAFDSTVPQEAVGINGLQENKNASAKLNNYEFVSNGGHFILHPIYSQTGGDDEIGYVSYDPNTTTAANAIKSSTYRHTLISNRADFRNYLKLVWKNAEITQNGITTTGTYTKGFDVSPSSGNYFSSGYNGTFTENGTTYKVSGPASIESRPFIIDEPAGNHIILYVKSGSKYNYSLQSLNPAGTGGSKFRSATIDTKIGNTTYKFVGLEDDTSGGDLDCNDIIFTAYGADVFVKVEDTDLIKTIAFEDLGSSDDYDFNDVVLKIAERTTIITANGNKKTTTKTFSGIYLMAAGGTLDTHVYYKPANGNAVDLFGEVHKAFGVNTQTMVNTGESYKNPVKSTTWTDSYPNYDISSDQSLAGFYIVVKSSDGTQTTTVNVPNGNDLGKVPQGLVIPYNWAWPKEKINITSAYSKFGQWGSTRGTNENWYITPTGSTMKVDISQ